MSAFNNRFITKSIMGIPLPAAGALLAVIVFGFLSVFLLLFLPLAVISFVFGIYVLYIGDKWPFRAFLTADRQQRNAVTSETRTLL